MYSSTHRLILVLAIGGLAFTSALPIARAESGTENLALSEDFILNQRLGWIEDRLELERPAAQAWWYGWTAFNAAATAAQATIGGITNDPILRRDMIVGGSTALVGFAAMFFMPFSPKDAVSELETFDEKYPNATLQSRLAFSEQLLRQSAADEASGRSWVAHLGNFLVAAVSSGILLGFKQYGSAAINFGASLVLGEVFIFTQPTRAISHWEEYRNRWAMPP